MVAFKYGALLAAAEWQFTPEAGTVLPNEGLKEKLGGLGSFFFFFKQHFYTFFAFCFVNKTSLSGMTFRLYNLCIVGVFLANQQPTFVSFVLFGIQRLSQKAPVSYFKK